MMAIIAGPSLTSCQKNSKSDPVIEVVSTPVQVQLLDMLKQLGLVSSSKSASVSTASIIAKGDLIEMGYYDPAIRSDLDLKINQDLCTKDKMVFDGTGINRETTNLHYLRWNISIDGTSIMLNKQSTKLDKPISENPGWNDEGTYKYVLTTGGIEEYKIITDGSALYQCTYISKTSTSITRKYVTGGSEDLTNITIVQK